MPKAILAKTSVSPRKIHLDEAHLRRLYTVEKLRVIEIAAILNCSKQTVFNGLAEYLIPADRIKSKIVKCCIDCGVAFSVFASAAKERIRCDGCKGSNRWGINGRHSIVACAECGASLHRPKCRVDGVANHFCDAKCSGQWQSKNRVQENHPAWSGGKKAKYARVEADPQKRLRRRISNQIWQSLKKEKNGKSWESLVGYTAIELKTHLERQFKKGMSWSNYGEWHIDHIVPVSSFSFKSPEDKEFLDCFALSNLRPLPGKDNIIKSNSREFLL